MLNDTTSGSAKTLAGQSRAAREWDVYNTQTGTVVAVHQSAVAAHRHADKLNDRYGVYGTYCVRQNHTEEN